MTSRLALFAAALAAPVAFAGLPNPYFIIDNESNGFFAGQLGVNGSDTLLQSQASTFWADLASYDGVSVLATDVANSTLYRLNTTTGAVMDAVMLDRNTRSIAYDASTGTAYGLSEDGAFELYTINLATGVTTTIGAVAVSDQISAVGLGFDPVLGTLVMSTTDSEMYTLSTADASASLVGHFGISMPFDIEYNPLDGNLYVADAGRDAIFLVDRSNATVSNLTAFANSDLVTGLAFVPTPGAGALLGLAGLAVARRRR